MYEEEADDTNTSAVTRGRRINKGFYASSDEEEPNKVLDIVDEYYKLLLEKLKNHLMLENVIRDEFAFTAYYNQMFEQLVDKLEKMSSNDATEYENLIKQAKFHLNTRYKDGMYAACPLFLLIFSTIFGNNMNFLSSHDVLVFVYLPPLSCTELFEFHQSQHELAPMARKYQELAVDKSQMFFLKDEVGDLFDSVDAEQNATIQQHEVKSLEQKAEVVNLHDEIQTKEQVSLPLWRRVIKFLSNFFPVLNWLPEYRFDFLNLIKNDIIAGVTIGAMLIPQGMGYAMIVGTPPSMYHSLVLSFYYFLLL